MGNKEASYLDHGAVKMSGKGIYHLSSILQIATVFMCLLAAILYYNTGANEYVNEYTILLTCFFSLQNIGMLSYQKKTNDPFILILVLVATLFYLTRVSSLLYVPWSLVLSRYSLTVDDFNYSFLYICISNISIFAGLISVRSKDFVKKVDTGKVKPAKLFPVILILLFGLFSQFIYKIDIEMISRAAGLFFGLFLYHGAILLLTIAYFVINFEVMPRRHKVVLALLFMILVILLTIMGSRSVFLTLSICTLCVLLSFSSTIKISKSSLFILLFLVPLMALSFLAATFLRNEGYDPKTTVTLSRIVNLGNFTIIGSEDISEDEVKLISAPIFDRAGFLSYAVDVITNHDQYSAVINFEYYLKSIVDNVLTPGFDIFETPRASNAFNRIYTGRPIPTKKEASDDYNSEMFTIYGESYILFGGYLAMIPLFFISFVFKKVYSLVNARDMFLYYLYRSLILLTFYGWLNSFGFDWMLGEVMSFLITIFTLKAFYKMRARRQVNSELNASIAVT